MNTSALKSFAPALRRQLLEAVGRKLDFVLTGDTADLRAAARQVAELRRQAEKDRADLIDRVAYTWFNRLAALRFLDARGWHPFRARVLTPATAEETQSELLKLTRTGALPAELAPFTDPARLNDLLDGRLPSPDPQGEVHRLLVLAACRFYHDLMPFLFEALDDETELLLPDDLLTEHSVAHGFRAEIRDEDCAEVEILGWLYQFYISEKKDLVMGRKSAVPTEDIPAVTQLFTPHWIVRYLVENSLGRLWLLNRPGSRLREHMPYYIEGEAETDFLKITKPEEIRLLDPASGSGHMLTYAFDLLYLIYEEEGHAPSEIPALILGHNLYGLEICPRAAQLAQFALVCKAREKSRTAFRSPVQPQVMCLQDLRFDEGELHDYIQALDLGGLFNEPILRLLHQFEDATTFGSLIQPCLDEGQTAFFRRAIEAKDLGSQLFLQETHRKVLRVLDQAEMLCQRYQVVVANPPYMGSQGMNARLKTVANTDYTRSKSDLFAMFMERGICLAQSSGSIAMVTMQSWMFLSSYEELRGWIINNVGIDSLIQVGYNSFPELNSKIAQACAFVLKNALPKHAGLYVNLNDAPQSADKETIFLERLKSRLVFRSSAADFKRIPGSPIAYWLSEEMRAAFAMGLPIGEIAAPRQGLASSDNDRFLKSWFEVELNHICFGASSHQEAADSKRKWFPYNKGGPYRKWFGNNALVVNWENDGSEILEFAASLYGSPTRTIKNIKHYFKPSITWSALSSSSLSLRQNPEGFLFDTKGQCIFSDTSGLREKLMAFLNSNVSAAMMRVLAPTLDFNSGVIAKVPFVDSTDYPEELPLSLVSIAKADWDNFETSWDFCDQSLLRPGLKGATLEASWGNWEAQSTAAIHRMQELETENNRLFIEAYGLQDELTPAVPEEQITLARPDRRKDMAAFLSYALGCMMGRYSLDQPGLILADAGDTLEHYLAKVGRPLDQVTFAPDEDGIIPVLDGEWFEDDIVARTRDFLRVTFGEATLEQNLRFIEESLGKDLRKYFLTDFYKDHLQTYKKRPIYWMFQSPKKGFNALIYLHRYTRDTANGVLNRYLREFLHKLRSRIEHLDHVLASESTPARDKTKARKESDQLKKALRECEEYERELLLPLAQQRVELDLDDGVKVNYLKLGEALAPIPGLAAKEED